MTSPTTTSPSDAAASQAEHLPVAECRLKPTEQQGVTVSRSTALIALRAMAQQHDHQGKPDEGVEDAVLELERATGVQISPPWRG